MDLPVIPTRKPNSSSTHWVWRQRFSVEALDLKLLIRSLCGAFEMMLQGRRRKKREIRILLKSKREKCTTVIKVVDPKRNRLSRELGRTDWTARTFEWVSRSLLARCCCGWTCSVHTTSIGDWLAEQSLSAIFRFHLHRHNNFMKFQATRQEFVAKKKGQWGKKSINTHKKFQDNR